MKRNIKLFEEVTETETEESRENQGGGEKKSKTPFLDNFGKDLTKMAEEGKLEPIHGREKEIFQVLLVLARKTKNNPVIIGEAGVGKTALVEGISQMIIDEEKCPESLQGKRIVYIDMGTLVAGSSKQGEFEKRIGALLSELEKNKDIILFIDEIHLMVNPSMAIDAANMFKPALARGDMRLIGATTFNEYRNSIEKDAALERRFQKVVVNEPSEKETVDILNRIKYRYEEYHNVSYSKEAIDACVNLSGKYMTDRYFPDKAIDLMDEVGARSRVLNGVRETPEIKSLLAELKSLKAKKEEYLKSQNFEESVKTRQVEKTKLEDLAKLRKASPKVNISAEDVAHIVSLKTGIPVEKFSEDEGTKLLNMEKELSLQIIGQDQAIKTIARCIKRNRAGLKDLNKPGGVFLFLGSTGVGKTETVKALAKYLFGTQDAMFRIDMSEYGEKHNVARLIGSPPGYVGYGEGGQLTEKVRRKPYCIILFDEVEKAHPDVLNLMLQIFDDGKLTDGQGRVVNFKNTIIVMTSNVGAREVREIGKTVGSPGTGFGFKTKAVVDSDSKFNRDAHAKSVIKKALEAKFAPEFLNRIDDTIIFNKLEKENIYKIIDIEMEKTAAKLKSMGYTLSLTDDVKSFLMEVGYDEEMGARPLKRAIQNYIVDPISEEILKKTIKDKILVDYDTDKKVILINDQPVQEKLKFVKKSALLVETNFGKFSKTLDGNINSRPSKKSGNRKR